MQMTLARPNPSLQRNCTQLGWSRKRLWSRFHSHIGIPPKAAAKLVRFDHAVHRLVAGEGAPQVAAAGGYYDQSHLHRDVMALTGTTPATVLSEPFLTVDDRAWPAPRSSSRSHRAASESVARAEVPHAGRTRHRRSCDVEREET